MASIPLILTFLCLFVTGYCQLSPVSVQLDGIGHITAGGDKVFASEGSTVYRYSSTNLLLEQNTEDLGNNIIGLSVTPDGQGLVVCLDNDQCVVRNGSDLGSPNILTRDNSVANPNAVFTAAVSNGQSFYVGSYGIIDSENRIRLGQYGFSGSSIERISSTPFQQSPQIQDRQFFSGFTYSDYAYFIVVDRAASSPQRRIRIIRVCGNETSQQSIRSQYELHLACGSDPLLGDTVIRGVSVFDEDMLVIGLNANTNADSRLCLFNITVINSLMDGAYSECVVSSTGDKNIAWISANQQDCDSNDFSSVPQPCNFAPTVPSATVGIAPSDPLSTSIILNNDTVLDGLRTSIGLSLDNINLIFVGYLISSNYYLNKYHWNNESLSLIEEVSIPSTGSFTVEQSIIVSEDTTTLYLTTPNEVVSLSVENCSSASSCVECVSLGDPLCGWCVFENKCSRSSLCMNSESTGRYLSQGEDSSCLERVDIVPSQFVKDIESMPYQLSVTFVPSLSDAKLPDEEFYCVFNITGTDQPPVMSLLYNGTCSLTDIVNQVTEISLSTELSILSNVTDISFFNFEIPYLFYDCAPQQMCSGCVIASGVCGWCQLDFTCTGDNTTCSEGVNNWLTTSPNEYPTDVCPLLVANNGGDDYTQPITVSDNLPLITLNTPTIPNLSYECVFGSTTTPAMYNSDTEIECQVTNGQLTSTGTMDFTLRQVYNGQNYNLGTNGSVDINVVLYDCPSLADSCSQCVGQNIDTGFNCGWCSNANQCNVATQCDNNALVTMSGDCGQPMITGINPNTGSRRGQTTITIDGTDLGVKFSDIVSVSVGSRSCNSIEGQYSTGVRIVCTISTDGVNTVGTATVTVTINTTEGLRIATSDQFTVLEPVIESVRPDIGPVSGGTMVTIRGMNLDVGNKENTRVLFREVAGNRKKRQSCPEIECDINDSSFNSTYLSCVSAAGGASGCVMGVVVNINNDEVSNNAVRFQYTPDPVFTSVTPQDIIPAGGIRVVFTGTNLNVTQSPLIRITDSRLQSTEGSCSTSTSDQLECLVPMLSPTSSLRNVYGEVIEYSIPVDGASGPDDESSQLSLTLQRNPSITGVIVNEIDLPLSPEEVIRIRGFNLTASLRDQIMITIGDYDCPVSTVSNDANEISCSAPNITSDVILFVNVTIGFLNFGGETDAWMVSFVTMATAGPSSDGINPGIIGGAVGGVAFVAIIIIIISVFLICCVARRASKKKDMRFIKLMNDMEKMEIEMAVTCKTAFAELQTCLGELVNEEALESQHLPFHTFPTYATKFFFPNAKPDHPVLCPPRLPNSMSEEDFKGLMIEFYGLIQDKGFLRSFIKTLESQTKVTVHEKSTIASLLMVSCLKDIDYATEILQILLGDLIRNNLSQRSNHPKILLRRTESVAEKLLTNWFCVTLYPHLRETVGPPLFVLFKAVKAQLEKGPIDVITGEAKNSLSEEKLLRQSLDFKVMECEVDMANGHYLLTRMKNRLPDFEPDNAASESDIQIVKLLDTDSISQTKEKLLDFLFRNRPVSQRPNISEVELELCRGSAGVPLKDQDTISKKEGEWTRINTLGHYDIPVMADAAIEDPKKPTPRFRLKFRGDRPRSGMNFDVTGTIIASASITSQTSLLNAQTLQSYESNTNKLYHLVKPDIGDGDSSKIVSEVFLTRLLSTKGILQPYVDDLFHAIFSIPPRGKPFPQAIKIFFDFLDLQAAELSIVDPEVLHVWKTNGLPLRFWVNLIKNPEFIFDINKSATIDACFTVIAQAYIDACSTSEVRYTKDTPSARLLYAKEVSSYKTEVMGYYDGVHSLQQMNDDELKQYFKETFSPLFKEFENHEGSHFHCDSALLELYRYALQYGDQIAETLQEDRMAMVAAQFNSLRQKYSVDSSLM